ncbi:MAG: metallophosphoesterase [Spirochaetia bacterium]|nr:metallophosphoesterase [Spirochaetia bacterium]
MSRTIFVGDVHGCYDELMLLIGKIKPEKSDRLIFVGDLINKGPRPGDVVDFVAENGFSCLMGNHEDHYVRLHQNHPRYIALRKSLSDFCHQWILNLPLYIEEKNFIAVHAGIDARLPLTQNTRETLLTVRGIEDGGVKIPWYQLYHGSKTIIYGHWAKQGLTRYQNTLGLDSGCVYGGSLSAYLLEADQILQVPAKRIYEKAGDS